MTDDCMVVIGDCVRAMADLPEHSVDAIVTDPPYELHSGAGRGFMGKTWDGSGVSFDPATWAACLRVLRPGGHLLAFGGTRTVHRIACAIEDGGFEIRDQIAWLYGSGFPKSMDVSKAIDREAGNERHDREVSDPGGNRVFQPTQRVINAGTPVHPLAAAYEGWGTAIKPACEPIVVARKPFKGTVAANVTAWGTGALNIDGCRIGTDGATKRSHQAGYGDSGWRTGHDIVQLNAGRWPANVALDEEAAAMLDAQSGNVGGSKPVGRATGFVRWNGQTYDGKVRGTGAHVSTGYGDTGGASRFFYVAKASRSERNAGLDGMPARGRDASRHADQPSMHDGDGNPYNRGVVSVANHHPTVKPIALMRWLVRLVTPVGGVVLDPFMGSGTTGCAARMEGFRFIGIEQDAEYAAIADRRIRHWAESG